MTWVVRHIRSIMLVSGALTCTMVYAAVAPQAALRHTFGSALEGPVGEVVVRNWGVLIALVGAMLIYGAFNGAVRSLVLTVAAVSKLAFLGLLITVGRPVLGQQAGVALVSDVIQVALFTAYLVAAGSGRTTSRNER